ncbi:MAG: hypothetical protein WDN69_15960 [Aliidongia sp.]
MRVFASDDYVTKLAQLLAYGSDGVNPYTSPQADPVYPPLTPTSRPISNIRTSCGIRASSRNSRTMRSRSPKSRPAIRR